MPVNVITLIAEVCVTLQWSREIFKTRIFPSNVKKVFLVFTIARGKVDELLCKIV